MLSKLRWLSAPKVYSNDRCTYAPVTEACEVNFEDIVFCQPQPKNGYYAHGVVRKWWYDEDPGDEPQWCFKIANMQGRPNGWCYMKHIYGKLTLIVHDGHIDGRITDPSYQRNR